VLALKAVLDLVKTSGKANFSDKNTVFYIGNFLGGIAPNPLVSTGVMYPREEVVVLSLNKNFYRILKFAL
jgi:hypothetical protein